METEMETIILGLYMGLGLRRNGREHGNYMKLLKRGYTGFSVQGLEGMEKEMEATITQTPGRI